MEPADDVRSKKLHSSHTRSRVSRAATGWGLTTLFVAALGYSGVSSADTPKAKPEPASAPGKATGGVASSSADMPLLEQRFEKTVWPTLRDKCLPCHGQANPSQLLLPSDPKTAFLKMISEGLLDPSKQGGITDRVTTSDRGRMMPPARAGMPLSAAEKKAFPDFADDIRQHQPAGDAATAKEDEVFPAYLKTPYTGSKQLTGIGNTFLSMQQLRGKIKTLFGDDGQRTDPITGAERDLFDDNANLFGGADFVKRFDESTDPSPQYLTGVDVVGRDVVSRAYLAHTGPFADFPATLPSPTTMVKPSPEYKAEINRLYNRLLYRDATSAEVQSAFALLQRIYKASARNASTVPQDLRFSLAARDDQGLVSTREISIGLLSDTSHALYSEYLDQSPVGPEAGKKPERTQSRTLAKPFTFAPGDASQMVTVTNEGTYGNVSVASVTLRGPLPATTETTIPITDKSIRLEGAWKLRSNAKDPVSSYEDEDQNKGSSRISFPVRVIAPGRYSVTVTWRRFTADKQRADAAQNVPVEVISRDTQSSLAVPSPAPIPPKGEAHFVIDQTDDTVPFWDLRTAFRFGGPNDGIEIENQGTHKRVTADAVRLMSAATPQADPLLLHASEAAGKDKWIEFKKGTFTAYNTVGPSVYQDTDADGKKVDDLHLLFQPTAASIQGFDPKTLYRVGIIYPGQANNEPRVPVIVHAQESAPFLQISHPLRACVGATVALDASHSFDVQHAPLHFRWTQTGGPRVTLKDPTAPTLSFRVPSMTAQQAAWEGLGRALLFEPDFLFTRPRSLATVTDTKTRRRLQLVKIAQDLVGRPPTAAEVAKVDGGATLASLVNVYMDSPEFQDFYFHRVRLYLESHGTPEQDEPARLWTYIMEKDRPFKEILTANYTVDTKWQKQDRPAYYGRTGLLTMKGFIEGKQGLPHFNYPAQVCEKFLGYVFEVPDAVVRARQGSTAASTTDPKSVCFSCHQILTPLAYQRMQWDDSGNFHRKDKDGQMIDATDHGVVTTYPFAGSGLEAFALQAQNKERFVRAILQTHFIWYWGRDMRYDTDERGLYRRLWDVVQTNHYAIRPLIRAMVLSPEYLNGSTTVAPPARNVRMAKAN